MTSGIRAWAVLSCLIGVFISACVGDAPQEWLGTIDTLPSGAIHVFNPERGIWGGEPRWRLVEAARIGARDGSGPEVFGNVWDIDVDRLGRVYVLDWQAYDVRLFEHDGSYVRTIGRFGGGPGEFRVANGIAVDSANRLWVSDPGNMRYSVFDTSGSLVTVLRKEGTGVLWAEWMSVFSADGRLIEHGGYQTTEGAYFGLREYDVATERLVDVNVALERPALPGARPFSTTFILTPEGWWIGDSYEYRLVHTEFQGDTVRIIERNRDPGRLSGAERDSAKQQERDLNRRSVQGDIDVETEVRLIFERLALDDVGYLWVMLSREPDDTITRFDLFDPVGRYLGELAAPHLVEPRPLPVFRNARIYYVTKDELDVQYVVVADIQGR
jgi:hypothetical protein